MSVSALDQLLLSIAGSRPPLAAAAKKRDPFAAHDLLTPFHRRDVFPTTNSSKHHQQRKRQHSHAQKAHLYPQPQPSLSLRLYGLKKNGWPRTLLAALRVDVDEPSSPRRSRTMDASVRLFFDGLLLQASGKASSQSSALPRLPWHRPSSSGVKSRPLLQIAVDPTEKRDSRAVGIPIDREMELVRARRKSPRRMSSPAGKRSRRCSSYEPREASKKSLMRRTDPTEELDDPLARTYSAADLDRVEAAIDAATADAMRIVAAEANAQLSFELMERKASNNTHYAATHGTWALDAHSVELQPSQDGSVGTSQPSANTQDEIKALRAENAEQKALIRQLLIENRRLLAQQQPQQSPISNSDHEIPLPAKRKRLSDPSPSERGRGTSSASTVSSASAPISRRGSLTFSIVDGYETFVDNKFDHLVSEITFELEELLSEDAFCHR